MVDTFYPDFIPFTQEDVARANLKIDFSKIKVADEYGKGHVYSRTLRGIKVCKHFGERCDTCAYRSNCPILTKLG